MAESSPMLSSKSLVSPNIQEFVDFCLYFQCSCSQAINVITVRWHSDKFKFGMMFNVEMLLK